ncbi:MAG: hypothetical protein QXL57_04905 [Candidatus Bathyarchaeia archaeon]
MPKLGNMVYPYIKLSRAIEIARRICESPYKGEISVSGLAQELKMSEKGGGFLYLVASLRDYGLVEGTGTLRATEIAKKIVAGTPEEMSKSRVESFLKVELFKSLKEKIGTEVPEIEQFSVILRDLTKADPLKVKNVAETIRNLYLDGVPYIKALEEAKKEEIKMTKETATAQVDISTAKPPMLEELKFGENVRIWLPKENIKEEWKKAKKMVDIYLGIEEGR